MHSSARRGAELVHGDFGRRPKGTEGIKAKRAELRTQCHCVRKKKKRSSGFIRKPEDLRSKLILSLETDLCGVSLYE